MVYYPKSQIKTNLYTPGDQLRVKSTKKEYTGYYWKTSKGEYFTGQSPKDLPFLELEIIPILPLSSPNVITIAEGNDVYKKFKNIDISKTLLVPTYQKPSPTKEDYNNGSFTSFFAKKNNQNLYIEISLDTYKKLNQKNADYDYKSYLIFTLIWILTGDPSQISSTNYNSVLLAEQRLKINSLGKYLNNNYLEFYKQES